MATEPLDDLLDDEDFWKSLRHKLLKNNQALWAAVWSSGGEAAYQLGAERVAQELGIKPIFRGKEYYVTRGRSLCEQLTDTDLSQIRDLLEEYWGVGEREFARQVGASEMVGLNRLKTIYRNEIHYSNEHAGLDQAREAGVETRSWLALGDERVCQVCLELEGENQDVPVNEPYSNGEMIAQGHIGCRCRTKYSTKSSAADSRLIGRKVAPFAIALT